jgi:uncharacterized protein (TIGR00375 family)
MIQKILDLHIHSKYSRAGSRDLELPKIAEACVRRGIDIVATGDLTHPKWFEHIKECLVEVGGGIYELKKQDTRNKQIINSKFLLGTELACIKKHKGETRRLHLCVFAPNIETVEKFNNKLEEMGFNLKSDGRPILGLTAKELLEIMLEVDKRMVLIPAHAWTPWFGVFGSKGGYDSLQDCFEELTTHIFAIETGLSSDPLMNWRCSMLDKIALVSNSDAHSTAKLGREANVMEFESEKDITYDSIMNKIKNQQIKYTVEFFPEEGKYHYDGHRDCQFVCHPSETKKHHGLCPKCKKPLVIGVMNRVEELADRTEEQARVLKRVPYKNLVPLPEVIADVFEVGVSSKAVQSEYNNLLKKLGNEFYILINAKLPEIEKAGSKEIADAIDRVRRGDIFVQPGYDGEFGVIKVFEDGKRQRKVQQQSLLLD